MKFQILRFTKKNRLVKVIVLGILIFISTITASIVIGRLVIKNQANNFAKEASENFHQDKIESLLMLIDSENYSLKEKNNAVWALGVLKNERALPKLQLLYTGEESNHEKALCQYEIKKAILKVNGDFKGSWQAANR